MFEHTRLSPHDCRSRGDCGVLQQVIDCLTADQTAAFAKTILADTMLSKLVEIKLPTTASNGY